MDSPLAGMAPRGFYDAHSSIQAETFEWAGSWLVEAVATMALPPEEVAFGLADFGCSTGGNSIRGMSALVSAFRVRRPSQHVVVAHNDLPTNDFNSLSAALCDATRENYYQCRGGRQPNVSVRLVPGSFYEPVLPPRSLHLGTCMQALEWLSEAVPASVPDEIFSVDGPTEVLERYRDRGMRDLSLFLRHRAVEMVRGGQLLISYPGRTESDHTVSGGRRALNRSLRDAARSGRIERKRYEAFLVPVYQPTLDDVLEAVREEAGPWEVRKAELGEIPVGFVEAFREDRNAVSFAERSTALVRAFTEPVLKQALLPPGGDSRVLDEVYEQMARRIAAAPDDHPMPNYAVAAAPRADLVGTGIPGGRPASRPRLQRGESPSQGAPDRRQTPTVVAIARHEARISELAQAISKDARRHAAAAGLHLPKADRALAQLPKDPEGPSPAEEIEGRHERAAAAAAAYRVAGSRPAGMRPGLRFGFRSSRSRSGHASESKAQEVDPCESSRCRSRTRREWASYCAR